MASESKWPAAVFAVLAGMFLGVTLARRRSREMLSGSPAVLGDGQMAAMADVPTEQADWTNAYRTWRRGRLDRVQASAQVWLGLLTTLLGLLGSVVLFKGGDLVTGVTADKSYQTVLIILVSLVFSFAVLAVIAGGVATWGGVEDIEPQNGEIDWTKYRDDIIGNANRNRIWLHISRGLGVLAAVSIAALAIFAVYAGNASPVPSNVIVVYQGRSVCVPASESARYKDVAQVIAVGSC